jgi:hypothetical protein
MTLDLPEALRGRGMRNQIFNAALAAIFLSNSAWADALIGGWKIEEKKNPITDNPWVIAQTEQSDAIGASPKTCIHRMTR